MICIHCGTKDSPTMEYDDHLTCKKGYTKNEPKSDRIKKLTEIMNTPNDIHYTILHGLQTYYNINEYQINIKYVSNEHHQDIIGWDYFAREKETIILLS